jgi:sugar-specific transcriptional regulator TrmB
MTVKKPIHRERMIEGEVNPLLERLILFGFSHAEASVYLYLLQKGIETGGSKIALGTGLHRQYVYLALPRLIDDGLVEEVAHGKQAKYKARPPHELEKIGRKKALYASDLARDLNVVSAIGNDQTFEVVQGVRAIQEHEVSLVTNADPSSWECYIIGGGTAGYSRVMGDFLEEYLEQMRVKKLPIRYIGSSNEIPFYRDYVGRFENQEYRFMDKLPEGVTHLVVRQDSVSFYSFLTPPLVYIVKSPQVAENYKKFFMMLWEMVDKNG